MFKSLKFAKREYLATVKTKGFIIGLVIAPILMSGSLVAFFLLKDNVDTSDRRVAIVDRSALIADAILEKAEIRNESEIFDEESGKKTKPAYVFEIIEPNAEDPRQQRLELSDRVRNGDFTAFLDIGANVLHPGENPSESEIAYYGKNTAMDELRGWLNWPINNQLRKLRLKEAGIDESEVADLFAWINVQGKGLASVSESGDILDAKRSSELEALLVPIVIMMLMFMMVMMSVPGMLQSVMEEKTRRIAEVLLGSITPFEFMTGKLIGGIAVSLTTAAVYLIGGIIVVNVMGYQEYIPYQALPWFVVYMVMAIMMFGSLSAALGSACSEPKDAQSLTFVTMIPMMIPMFVYFPVAKEPSSLLATILSLVPIFTPTLMVLRLASPDSIPIWQPIIGLFGVILTTVLFIWIGARIFRIAILIQGTPPKLSRIMKWVIKG